MTPNEAAAPTRIDRSLKTRRVKLSALVADESNKRTHDERNLAAIEESIRKHGVVEPLVVQKGTNRIVAGNGRAEALRRIGYTHVDVVDVEIASEEEFRALSIRLNRTGELAGWDGAGLEADLAMLAEAGWGNLPEFGFDESALDELARHGDGGSPPHRRRVSFEAGDGSGKVNGEDPGPDVASGGTADTQPGVIYQLGPHRLVCGDATDREIWALFGLDRETTAVVTSPPYGVGPSHHLRNHLEAGVSTPKTKFYASHDDDPSQWPELMDAFTERALDNARCVVVNVQMLSHNKRALAAWIAKNADRLIDVVIWDKGHGPPQASPSTLTTVFEFVIGLGDIKSSRRWPMASFQGDRTNVIRASPRSSQDDADGHGARFSVDFATAMISTLVDDARTVVDPFGGTGTTMIAASKLGVSSCLIEIDPIYCDSIRRRWTKFARSAGVDPGAGALG